MPSSLKCLADPNVQKITRYKHTEELNADTSSFERKSFQAYLQKSRTECRKPKRFAKKSCKGSKDASGSYDSNPWITGGPIGTKDAVLVFRPSALQSSGDEKDSLRQRTLTDSNCSLGSSSSNVETKDGDHVVAEMYSRDDEHHAAKVLESLPKNTVSKTKSEKLDQLFHGTDIKKRLHEDLSSSENSISSACDDPEEIEDDIAKAVEGCDQQNDMPSTSKSSKSCGKQQSNDEKENMTTSSSEDLLKKRSEMPASVLKITYKFLNTETRLLRRLLASHGLVEAVENQGFNLLWTGAYMKPDILRGLMPYQRVNHFPRSYELTRKDRLYKNIERMQHLRGFKHFDIVPLSFMLPSEYRDLVTAHRSGHRGPWIVKPAASSRGRGIFIVNSPDQIQPDEQVLVSKYIADPLCIDGHKCDVRIYVAVTSFDPLLIYMYEEGLVRLATVKYEKSTDNLWNPCMHLCNYSINKYHSDYIKANDECEDVGHKWTFSALLRHLKSQNCDISELMMNIEDVIVKAILASSQSIVSACRMFVPNNQNCFELYGVDILIDDTLKPWLLEFNLSPSLGIDTPLDAKVKSSMLADLLTLTGIPAFSPSNKTGNDSKWTRLRSTVSRRTHSADLLNSSGGGGKKSNSNTLSTDEIRVIRNVRAQWARRGGFVSIFPTSDTMSRYGMFLDPVTGIPVSSSAGGSVACPMIIPHNYNLLLHHHFFGEGKSMDMSVEERMKQYERVLEADYISFGKKTIVHKCTDEASRLRKQMRKLIENGNELTQFQARKMFARYLNCVLRRLSQEPRSQHEKMILKFITRSGLNIKTTYFMKPPYMSKIMGKDRSAIVAKFLGDYLEIYNKETEEADDSAGNFSPIPSKMLDDFLDQAQEADLESVLTWHTNVTKCMPFLYGRCSNSPPTPPIPVGSYGFLKAMPSMVPQCASREIARIDTYYRSIESKTSLKDKEKDQDERAAKRVTTKVFKSNLAASSVKKPLNS